MTGRPPLCGRKGNQESTPGAHDEDDTVRTERNISQVPAEGPQEGAPCLSATARVTSNNFVLREYGGFPVVGKQRVVVSELRASLSVCATALVMAVLCP